MRARVLWASVVALLCTGCWTQVGFGPDRRSSTPFEHVINASNVAQLEEIWRQSVGAPAQSPVVFADHVVVTGGALTTSLDWADGDIQWQQDHTPQEPCEAPPCPTLILGAPALQGNQPMATWMLGPLGGIFVYDITNGDFTSVNAGHHSFDIASRSDLIASIFVQFRSSGGFVISAEYGSLRGLIHETSGSGFPIPTSPMLLGNRVYVSTQFGSASELFAFDVDTCPPSTEAGFCAPAWHVELGSNGTMPVAISSTQVAVSLANGQFKVINVSDGSTAWTGLTGSTFANPPAVEGDRIYVGTNDGNLRAFDDDGCGAATCNALWSGDAAAAISRQAAVANGLVYVGTSSGTVVAFDAAGCGAATCPSLWTGTTATGSAIGAITGGPVIANGQVYVGTGTSQLVAFALD